MLPVMKQMVRTGDAVWDKVNKKLKKIVRQRLEKVKIIPMKKYGYRCHEVGGSALTVCVLMATGANSILVKGSANLLSFPPTRLQNATRSLFIHRNYPTWFHLWCNYYLFFYFTQLLCVSFKSGWCVYASLLRRFIQHFVVFSLGSDNP